MLRKLGIRSALDFARVPMSLIRRAMGKAGVDLWRELNGEAVFALETGERLPRSMARTASLGWRTRDGHIVRAHLLHHAFRLSMDMLARGLTCDRVRVMLRLGDFRRIHADVPLETRGQGYELVSRAAIRGLRELWRGVAARSDEVGACGVIALRLQWKNPAQGSLLPEEYDNLLPLWRAVRDINQKHGRGTIQPAGAIEPKPRTDRPRFRYPVIKT